MAHAEPATATLASKSPITTSLLILDLLLCLTLDEAGLFAVGQAREHPGMPVSRLEPCARSYRRP